MSLVLFNFFAEVTGASVGALVVRENLLRKMRFPHIVIPLSIAVTGPAEPRHDAGRGDASSCIAIGVYPDGAAGCS